MNKAIVTVIILFLVTHFLYADDVYFRVIKDTPTWNGSGYFGKDVPKGTVVKGYSGVSLSQHEEIIVQTIRLDNGDIESVYADALLPLETESLFPESLLTDPENTSSHIFILEYCVDALASKDRDKTWNYDWDYWEKFITDPMYIHPITWTGGVFVQRNLLLTQTGIEIYYSPDRVKNLLIKNIRKEGNGYRATVKYENQYSAWKYGSNVPWPDFSEHEFFDILIVPDGDYLDMYLDNLNTPLVTFASVNKIFIEELKTLVKTESCNLANVTWPRRSNGSMDYSPPVDMSGYKTTHHTTDNLRLRSSSNTSSGIVTTLRKGSAVQVLETGTSQTIDGITAPWVKVLSESGYTGWCFSGYLKAK